MFMVLEAKELVVTLEAVVGMSPWVEPPELIVQVG